MIDQILIFLILLAALVLFVWGRFRYDVVALLALLAVGFLGLLPVNELFSGFSHPAIISVAAILVVSQALTNAGIADLLSRWVLSAGSRRITHLTLLMIITAVASMFMNNVGALALVLPVAVRLARQSNYSPSRLLMPLAFASLLGGMTTLIGTPPNIIISTYRADAVGTPYNMFDFTPVGVAVAVVSILIIILISRRVLPVRSSQEGADDLFHIEDYLIELRVPDNSQMIGQSISAVSNRGIDVLVVGLVRNKQPVAAPSSHETLQAGDLLLIEINATLLDQFLEATDLQPEATPDLVNELLRSDDVTLQEVVVGANSPLVNTTARELNVRWRYGVNLLAVSRQGERISERLGNIVLRPGDVLLMQMKGKNVAETLRNMRVLPLAQRPMRITVPGRLVWATAIFGLAILATTLQLVPIELAFSAAAVMMVMTGLLTLRQAYDAIEWPVIILLGAMIPVGTALETTGGAAAIAGLIGGLSDSLPAWAMLTIVMAITMTLSDVINNAATAVLMAPIAVGVAQLIGSSPDPFLLGVAIAASCAFLTPIGHQSNTLVMGPGGYQFGDYWKLGLPVEIAVLLVSVPMLMWIWG